MPRHILIRLNWFDFCIFFWGVGGFQKSYVIFGGSISKYLLFLTGVGGWSEKGQKTPLRNIKTAPYQLLTVLACWEHKTVSHISKSKQKQFCVPALQTFSNLGKFSEIKKQFHVKSWLTYQSYSPVLWI